MEKLGNYAIMLSLGEAMVSLRQRLEQDLLAHGADPDAVADMIVALNEATVNIVRHGYRHPGPVEMTLYRQENALRVELCDDAPLFDPTRVPTPDITVPLAQRPFGGMGIHMMREFLDELKYEQTVDGRNQLTLIKHDAFT
jgi:serine/threonine-protein kinase RsbW